MFTLYMIKKKKKSTMLIGCPNRATVWLLNNDIYSICVHLQIQSFRDVNVFLACVFVSVIVLRSWLWLMLLYM